MSLDEGTSEGAEMSSEQGGLTGRGRTIAEEPGGYVAFGTAGDAVKGEFHCSGCGYGITVYRELPICPMCAGTIWEQVPWSPLTRALGLGTPPRALSE
jgi:rubredoxin